MKGNSNCGRDSNNPESESRRTGFMMDRTSSQRDEMMTEPTPEQIHWNQLRKQHLLDEKVSDCYEVAKAQLGLHSTDYWTPYFSVWARIGDFDARRMFESINNGERLVRTHAFRTTLHVIHIDNLSMIISATGPALYKVCRNDKFAKVDQLSDREIEHMLSHVREALQDGPLRTSALKRIVPDKAHVRSALLMLMARGEVVRAKANHARSNLTSYALLDRWVSGFRLKVLDEQEATTKLIRGHIGRFGPVSVDDIAWWLNLTKAAVKRAVQNLGDDITMILHRERECYMRTSDHEIASAIERPEKDIVWFLPYEDHFLKAFIDRTDFINEDIQARLSPADRRHYWPSNPDAPRAMLSRTLAATGEVRPSIWLNGRVVGRWEIDDLGEQKRIVTSLYTPDARDHHEGVEQVRSELEDFVNQALLPISTGR